MASNPALLTTTPAGRSPRTVIARLTARNATRSAAVWGCVFGLYIASSALTYASAYGTPAARERLAATFGSNSGLSALLGPARQLQTVAGYTVWKCLGVLAVMGAIWGLLTGTRLLRGEEDSGRWELLLTGHTTRRGAAVQALAGLAAGLGALWVLAALITVVVGRSTQVGISAGQALYLTLAAASGAMMFLGVGALASQLAATRRQAAGIAATFLGLCFGLRMVADSSPNLGWLRWASPLGWIEQLQPLTAPRPVALVPIFVLTASLAGLTAHLAGSRDVGASVLPDRSTARLRPRLLSGPTGLTVRLVRPTAIGWVVGIAGMAVLVGLVARSAGNALSDSTTLTKAAARLGASGTGAKSYLGVAFLIMAVLIAGIAAGQISATRNEEATGRLEHLLVRPVSRSSWLAGRLAVATALLVTAGLVTGFVAWVGAASQGSGVGLAGMLAAGISLVPPAVVVLGAGTLGYGLRPRSAAVVAYAVLTGALLLELVGGIVNANHWLLDAGVFHHLSAAPAVTPNWQSGAILVVIGVAAACLGVIALSRRDLAGE